MVDTKLLGMITVNFTDKGYLRLHLADLIGLPIVKNPTDGRHPGMPIKILL